MQPAGRAAQSDVSWGECALWALLVLALITWRTWPTLNPYISNDATQYMSIARNTLEGRPAHTSVVHFDEERSFGVLPAPVVTFPSGYPLAIAAVSKLGFSVERAGLLVSALSAALSVVLLLRFAVLFDLARPWSRAMAAVVSFNCGTLGLGTEVMCEMLFTVLVLGGCLLLAKALQANPDGRGHARGGGAAPWALALSGGLLVGLSYWVRYAGMFVAAGLGFTMVCFALQRRWRAAQLSAAALAIAGTLVAAGMLRNILLVHSWRGGNNKSMFNNPFGVVLTTVKTADHLFFGETVTRATLVLRVLVAICLVLAAWRVVRALRRMPDTRIERWRPGAGLFAVSAIVLTYCAALFYAGITTVISFSARYFTPILPVALVVLAVLLTKVWPAFQRPALFDRASRVLLGAAFVLYVATNQIQLRSGPINENTARVERRLGERVEDGRSVRDVIESVSGPGGVLVANDAQMTAYVMGHPAVSLLEPHFSRVEWNEAAVRDLVTRYGGRVLVVNLPAAGQPAGELLYSSFLADLGAGRAPAWLEPVAATASVRVYRPSL